MTVVARTELDIRQLVKQWRVAGERVAFVPTMGNLHAGHISLVEEAKRHADRVVVSIFVNPMQFNDASDLDKYPRTFDADKAKLQAAAVDVLFFPEVATVYPQGMAVATKVVVPGLSEILEGEHRPGHFTGVTTVVCKLFNLVQPDCAVFGKKDYQQLMLIQQMTQDLNLPIKIIAAQTKREEAGLAMSSRNGLMDDKSRDNARKIHEVLELCSENVENNRTDFPSAEKIALQALSDSGFEPEYVAIRRQCDLLEPAEDDKNLVILVAARFAGVRLIDNVELRLV